MYVYICDIGVCVYVCSHECGHVCTYVWVQVEARGWCWVPSSTALHLIYGAEFLSWSWIFSFRAGLANQLALGILDSVHIQCTRLKVVGLPCPPSISIGSVDLNFWPSFLWRNKFNPLSHFLRACNFYISKFSPGPVNGFEGKGDCLSSLPTWVQYPAPTYR